MNGTQTNWLSNLSNAMRADPKKTAVLTVLGLVLVFMVIRTVSKTGGRPTPKAASAASVTDGKGTSGAATPVRASQGQPDHVVSALRKWSSTPVPPVSRNLFSVRTEYFPSDGTKAADAAPGEEGFWSKLEKSLALQTDQIDKRENLVANYTAQASKLRLESIIMGPQPRAMVNGDLVGEGSVVAGFRVLKIEARRITVEREGIKLEIQMR